jgi:hypothetical protein
MTPAGIAALEPDFGVPIEDVGRTSICVDVDLEGALPPNGLTTSIGPLPAFNPTQILEMRPFVTVL